MCLENFCSFVKHVEDPFDFQRKRGISLERLQYKRASLSLQARISSVGWSCGWKLRVPRQFPFDLGDHSCFLREVRSPLALQGPPWDSSRITGGMNRASSRSEGGTSVFLCISDFNLRVSAELEQESQASSCDEVGTPLAPRVVQGVTGHLSSCIWILWLFPDDATGMSVPIRFVTSSSGLHWKRCQASGPFLRGLGNWCLSECGMTHEASFKVSM